MPTMNYRLKSGKRVKGVTTVLNCLAKPALVPWGYSQGLENYARVTEGIAKMIAEGHEDPNVLLGLVMQYLQEFQVSGLYEKRDKAADAGTLGHALVEHDIKGLPAPSLEGVPNDTRKKAEGCFLSYLEWKDTTKFKLIYSEVSLVSEAHGFGGCLDIGGETTSLELIDLKTSKGIYWSMWVQVAGYGILWNENHSDNPIQGYNILRIGPDGDFGHERKTNLDDEMKAFLHVLGVQNILDKKGIRL